MLKQLHYKLICLCSSPQMFYLAENLAFKTASPLGSYVQCVCGVLHCGLQACTSLLNRQMFDLMSALAGMEIVL